MRTALSVIGLGELSKYVGVLLCDGMGTRRREKTTAEKQGEGLAGYLRKTRGRVGLKVERGQAESTQCHEEPRGNTGIKTQTY